MIDINEYIDGFSEAMGIHDREPWEITQNLNSIVEEMIARLGDGYKVENGIAVHHSAVIEHNVTIKAPAIIGRNCYIGANSYLRNGVIMMEGSRVGTSCEIKSSILGRESAVAHFNYIGDSIIGSRCNFEAGAVTANHFNERADKTIFVIYRGQLISTHIEKFGALVGDDCKIGANAVLTPGTLLEKNTVVGRLQLVNQTNNI